MKPAQPLLFADPRPLVERLGGDFFREVPKRPGVYLMRDAADKILYVGKAKNLRQRLRNYRIANPDAMPRRHLRMVREVARIEFQLCGGETAALRRESKLLRSLRPKFNRAGVWPGKTKFLVWRMSRDYLELDVMEVPETGWQRFGPISSATQLRGTLARLIWLATNEGRAFTELPSGWAQGRFTERTRINCGHSDGKIVAALETFFWSEGNDLLNCLASQFSTRTHPFERRVIETELEVLKEFAKRRPTGKHRHQLGLL